MEGLRVQIDLTKEQQDVVLAIAKGIKKGTLVQTLGGYAGVGKSSLVSYLLQIFNRYAVCAYTGKAANVLRNKGCSASTIHSLIYQPFKEPDGTVTFHLKQRHELDVDGFFVDEASMVSQEQDADLRSFGLPIVYVGDHGQLPPVGNDFNIMSKPMYCLETIHRNAGTIAQFCEWVRKGHSPRSFPDKANVGKKVKFLKPWDLTNKVLIEVDQMICAFNKTRIEYNTKTRNALGFTELLHLDERIMCLRNNRKAGVFNGMQGTVTNFYTNKKRHFLEMESNGMDYEFIRYDPKQFNQEKLVTDYSKDGPLPFDYAYCVTCHKAQGDEWGKVLVMEQVCKGWDHNRWCYTAASRAKDTLLWCS
jgi:exodeoxyribonuclease-5